MHHPVILQPVAVRISVCGVRLQSSPLKFRAALFRAFGKLIALVALSALPPGSLLAQENASDNQISQPLLPNAVLRSSATYHPQIQAAIAKVQQAKSRTEATQGAFDTNLSNDSRARLTGTWDGRYSDWGASQQLRPFGAKVYGKYRISGGSFPIYEDQYFTNELGELKLGVLVSLLRDRSIDARRFAETDAELAEHQAELDTLLVRISVQRRALIAYWRWLTAGRQLEVYTDLLRIARKRESGLESEVREGGRAAIELVENRQNIIRRQELVTTSDRNFKRAAYDLALFYRDIDGKPLTPTPDQLPTSALTEQLFDSKQNTVYELPSITARPERKALQTAIERINRDIKLRRNNMRPKLDLNFELGRDIGSVAEGGSTRNGTDSIVSLSLRVPLQRRAARGKLNESKAKLKELNAQLTLITDQLQAQMRALVLELETTVKLLDLVSQEVTQTRRLREAEYKRFENGASDFFLVNLREQAAADADLRYHSTRMDAAIAQISYDAAVINLGRLQLDGEPL